MNRLLPRTSEVRLVGPILAGVTALLLSACAISPEIQAKMDEFDRTIPTCSNATACQTKWAAARDWTVANSSFSIRGNSDTRIFATGTLISQGGIGVVVNRVQTSDGYQIVVDMECFSAYSCPGIWDSKIDFNRTLNNVR